MHKKVKVLKYLFQAFFTMPKPVEQKKDYAALCWCLSHTHTGWCKMHLYRCSCAGELPKTPHFKTPVNCKVLWFSWQLSRHCVWQGLKCNRLSFVCKKSHAAGLIMVLDSCSLAYVTFLQVTFFFLDSFLMLWFLYPSCQPISLWGKHPSNVYSAGAFCSSCGQG